MKAKKIASFEALVATRYGAGSPKPVRMTRNCEDLLRTYYGARKEPICAKPKPALAHMQSRDDGEILAQKMIAHAFGQSGDVSTASPPAPPIPVATKPDPGVVPSAVPAPAVSPPPAPVASPGRDLPDADRARQEELLDLVAPIPAPGTTPSPVPVKASETVPPRAAAPQVPPSPPVGTDPPSVADGPAKSAAEKEDEFLEDMKAIMSGRKAYDPASKQVVDRHGMNAPPEAHSDPIPPPAAQPLPATSSAHDIFTQIARSMEYAGAYDLGEVELENRFAQFDQAEAARRTRSAPPPAPPVPPAPTVPPAPKAANSDEIAADLQDMLARPEVPAPPQPPKLEDLLPSHGAIGEPAPSPPPAVPLSFGAERLPDYARPLFDTGEHVLAGDTLYPDQLRIGPNPGVAFSYGDIIAMADLYDDDRQLTQASLAELTQLKAKVRQSADHYRAASGQGPAAPGTKDWKGIVGPRYTRLAEDNFAHFAPNLIFRDKAFAAKVGNTANHRDEWEKYHFRAIEEAQRLALAPANQGVSYVPETALLINAFGDHFLTDAFSAGHVINKAEAMGLFYANFYSGKTLNAAGEAFFAKVAAKAFRGQLAQKFSILETYDPVFLWWNPNIDTENAFRKLLIKIANDQDHGKAGVANLAVKALHDKLNREGIMVTNGRNAQAWKLYGDGNLSKHPSGTTLRIMREAVQQSVANILDPGILKSNLDPAPFFERVWAYVPQLTAATRADLVRTMPTFLHPGSDELVTAAADILHVEVETLIEELIRLNKLKYA